MNRLKQIVVLGFYLIMPMSIPATAQSYNHMYFDEENLSDLINSDKRLVLVTSGWSQTALEKMQLTKNQQKQKRGFAPAYLLATRMYQNNGKVKVFYLTTTEIHISYRQYLYKMSTGDDQLANFDHFEKEFFKIVKFDLPKDTTIAEDKSQRLNYFNSQKNKNQFISLVNELKSLQGDPQNQLVGFTMHATGHYLQQLAKQLNIPFLANPPAHAFWIRKSFSRISYKAAGIPHPKGTYTPAKTLDQLAKDILQLLDQTKANRVIIKLDRSAAGDGNKVIDFSKEIANPIFFDKKEYDNSLDQIKNKLQFPPSYLKRFTADGAIIEEYLSGYNFSSPATMSFINNTKDTTVYYQYTQVLGGLDNQVFQGSKGPLAEDMIQTQMIKDYSKKITEFLSTRGVRGHVGIDFVVFNKANQNTLSVYAIENNVRQTGTMYPYLSSLFLLGKEELNKSYISTFDGLRIARIRNMKARNEFQELFFNWLIAQPYHFNQNKKEGLFVHLPTFGSGNLAISVIAKNEDSAQAVLEKFKKDLDQFLIENKYAN